MPQTLELGPLLIHTDWIIAAVSAVLAYFIFFFHFFSSERKTYGPVVSTGLLAFFVIFQFSTLLMHPTAAFRDPLAMIAFPGGAAEWILSGIIIISIIFFQGRKHGFSIQTGLVRLAGCYMLTTFFYLFFSRVVGFEDQVGSVIYMTVHVLAFWGLVYLRSLSKLTTVVFFYGIASGVLHLYYPIETYFVFLPASFFFVIAGLSLIGLVTAFLYERKRSR
ncbi:hypothetical protein [Salsuginibacillus kocurii]|uniref:hypothetical protein n=1 Tax=Salsuginibacillus kocurii TaxID=427078 RepID=UPI0003778A88|nr:hypothetical protein [Salsuginibacillus kocurii]